MTSHRVRWRLAAIMIAALASGVLALALEMSRKPQHPPSQKATTAGPRSGTSLTAVNCISHPSGCGYPDQTNTGVPAGTALRPSNAIDVTTAGTVISGLDVRGTIRVGANDVTIKNTRVTAAYPQGGAIFVEPKVSGTLIEDSTVRGQDSGPNAVAYAVLNAGWPPNASTVVQRVQMYNCTECYDGPGTLEDSYANVSATIEGAHYEDVYYGGGAGSLTVRHDTLLNPQRQTAVVFTKPDYGVVSDVTVSDSLLAGGGWSIYGGGDSASRVRVINNRFSPIYHPRVGYFGIATGFNWSQTEWTGNRWDTTLLAVHG